MSEFIQCCPVCGRLLSYKNISCVDCGYSKKVNRQKRKELRPLFEKGEAAYMPVDLYTSSKPKEYYERISKLKYNTPDNWKDVFVEEELSNNPLYDSDKYTESCRKKQEQEKRRIDLLRQQEFQKNNPSTANNNQPNQPHCPTCNSTSIKKISDLRRGAHAIAWGLLSTTARSQFECKNCGYKW